MSFLNKNYVFVRHENFDGFLRKVGVPEEKIQQLLKFSFDQKLTKDGDTYTFITKTPEGPKEIKFKSGIQFDDVIGADNTPIKTTYVVDGNTVTQTIIAKPEQGTAIFKREYEGDTLTVTVTMDTWDGIAKRYYKAE